MVTKYMLGGILLPIVGFIIVLNIAAIWLPAETACKFAAIATIFVASVLYVISAAKVRELKTLLLKAPGFRQQFNDARSYLRLAAELEPKNFKPRRRPPASTHT